VTGLGAAWTVEPDQLVTEVKAIAPNGVHAALHLAGDGDLVAGLLADGGRLASTLHYQPMRSSIVATDIMADPHPETLARLAAEVAEGNLRVPLAKTYPLEEAAVALDDFAAGTVGKLAIAVDLRRS
jgi:NADPH:quinone reductase-like Zn-dependent oxidoreductase